MKIVGIDPGKEGYAICTDSENETYTPFKFKYDKNNLLQYNEFDEYLQRIKPDHIVIEAVRGRGGWSATVNFTFGFIYGQILNAVTRNVDRRKVNKCGIVNVVPLTWQNEVSQGLFKSLRGKSKMSKVYEAIYTYDPLGDLRSSRLTLNHNIVDAFLISMYGQHTIAKSRKTIFNLKEYKND
jgi:hypothetical protein